MTELLRDNLYEFSKFNRESGAENYFTLPRLQKIARECLVGLQFVHGLGLIHCDLKPENIFLVNGFGGESDFVKVLDFGIAREQGDVDRLTLQGQVIESRMASCSWGCSGRQW